MANYLKYTTFVGNLCDKQLKFINATTDTVNAIIHTDDTPLSSNSVSSCTQISAVNGYSALAVAYTCTNTAGLVEFKPTADTTWTATGGNLGNSTTGRFFSLYDATSTGTNLIVKFDYAATFTVQSGETMTLDYGTVLFSVQ